MKPTRHILVLLALLTAGISTIWAQDAQMDGLHCGDIVTITATPDDGYQFVRWSDGNTDNPREIEITEAVSLTAFYEPMCHKDTVPVMLLYQKILLVDVRSLQTAGYNFSEQNVTWYRIVGDTDVTEENKNEKIASGYSYPIPPGDSGGYYAAVDISDTPSAALKLCSTTLYSRIVWIGATDIDAPPIDTGNKDKAQKVIINNRLYILLDGKVYNAVGGEVR